MSSNGERKTLKLRHPVRLDDEEPEVAELRFRDLTAGDMRGMSLRQLQALDVDTYVKVIGKLTGQVDGLIRKMHALDFKAAMVVVDGFFDDSEDSPEDGTAPSPS